MRRVAVYGLPGRHGDRLWIKTNSTRGDSRRAARSTSSAVCFSFGVQCVRFAAADSVGHYRGEQRRASIRFATPFRIARFDGLARAVSPANNGSAGECRRGCRSSAGCSAQPVWRSGSPCFDNSQRAGSYRGAREFTSGGAYCDHRRRHCPITGTKRRRRPRCGGVAGQTTARSRAAGGSIARSERTRSRRTAIGRADCVAHLGNEGKCRSAG